MGGFLDLLFQSVVEIVVHLLDELVVGKGAQIEIFTLVQIDFIVHTGAPGGGRAP